MSDASSSTPAPVQNTSGFEPLGRAVLIAPYETDETMSSTIVIPDSVKSQEAMVEQKAIVIAVGDCAWMDEPNPRARPGDHVLVTKFAGYMAMGLLDGKRYRLVNDRDIFARVLPTPPEPQDQN